MSGAPVDGWIPSSASIASTSANTSYSGWQQKQDAQVHLLYAFQFIYFRWSVFVSVGQLLNILVPLNTCITTGKVQKSELNKFNMVYAPLETIERAHRGVMDYIKHALTLFTDFAAVLIIMLKNVGDNSKDKKRRRS
ncbi:uncharacterized protein [Triticum aestivum]|uniref:uncharacterized protein n=1 Tax=Triticum aestivum TaxID=4565 RepID=UPI001D00EC7D|nr:uncharacterized protein LOC123092338 [Triticum aestivum]